MDARRERSGRPLDNINTRTGDAAAEWLRKHPRVQFVFGILARWALRHRSFANVTKLTTAIYRFGKHWNAVAGRPFDWT